jgi:Tfp pilus assembly protein PilF
VLKQAGAHDEAQLLLANLYQQRGKIADARRVYQAFLQAHPDHAKAGWVRNLLQTL